MAIGSGQCEIGGSFPKIFAFFRTSGIWAEDIVGFKKGDSRDCADDKLGLEGQDSRGTADGMLSDRSDESNSFVYWAARASIRYTGLDSSVERNKGSLSMRKDFYGNS